MSTLDRLCRVMKIKASVNLEGEVKSADECQAGMCQ